MGNRRAETRAGTSHWEVYLLGRPLGCYGEKAEAEQVIRRYRPEQVLTVLLRVDGATSQAWWVRPSWGNPPIWRRYFWGRPCRRGRGGR